MYKEEPLSESDSYRLRFKKNLLGPRRENDPTLADKLPRRLESATRGRGLQPIIDPEKQRANEELQRSYKPFASRVVEEADDNFNYVETKREQAENEVIRENDRRKAASSAREPMDFKVDESCFEDFYEKYDFSVKTSPLPIDEYKSRIYDHLEVQNVLVIQGNTGCGKTTRVPQIILDHHHSLKRHCNIVVTQPRRLAAISVCRRVCNERAWKMGTVCGYHVGLERRTTDDTRITYMTHGLLFQKIVGCESSIKAYTHVVLDEIHDRELDTDFILLLTKLILMKGYNIKVVLMSATLDSKILRDYFRSVSYFSPEVPVVKCFDKLFDVEEFYLEQIAKILNVQDSEIPVMFYAEPELRDETIAIVGKLLKYLDFMEIQNNPTEETIRGFPCSRGSVLIFIPGMEEIGRVESHLRANYPKDNLKFHVLHSEIPIEHQVQAFERPTAGVRKVILSTSIAESSITVPDIKYVIDFCLTKSLKTDEVTGCSMLSLEWASKSNMDQRRGRAGRVSQGKCYRMITTRFMKDYIQEYPSPAILREPLDKLILNVKRLKHDKDPKELLSLALTPPKALDVERSVLYLKEAGALSLYKDGEICYHDGDLTYPGTIMSQMPVDVKLAKLILFGHVFGKLREAVIIASALSVRSIFIRPPRANLESYINKFKWSGGLFCDFNCIINAVNLWEFNEKYNVFRNYEEKKEWAQNHMLDIRKFKEMLKIKNEIINRLKQLNIHVSEEVEDLRNVDSNKKAVTDETEAINRYYLIKFMVAAAFYPNYFVTNNVDQENVIRDLNCKNPMSTVQIKGFPKDEGILYHKLFKQYFEPCADNISIYYDSMKAFVEFKDVPKVDFQTKISMGVYIAICMKKLRLENRFPRAINEYKRILNRIRKCRELESSRSVGNVGEWSSSTRPSNAQSNLADPTLILKSQNEFKIKIVYVKAFGHFYAHLNERSFANNLRHIENSLNSERKTFYRIQRRDLCVGKLVCCPRFDEESSEFKSYRARIVEFNSKCVKVFFVDYGYSEEMDFEFVWGLDDDLAQIPFHAIEFKLINVRLSPLTSNKITLLETAREKFHDCIRNLKLIVKVYSIVQNVVRCSLMDVSNELFQVDISQKLIKLGLCEKSEEDMTSQNKHWERMNLSYWNENSLNGGRSNKEWLSVQNLDEMLDQIEFDNFSDRNFFELRGTPYTPLEVTLNTKTRILSRYRSNNVRIDRDSINYVLLDDEPEVDFANLVISHKVDESEKNDSLILRDTCLMPKIRGLVSLCLLIFAPAVELRVDKKKNYTGALCGLGYDQKQKKPVFTDNDIEHIFDIPITSKDVSEINSLRHLFNSVIGNESSAQRLCNNKELLAKKQSEACGMILRLLKKQREKTEEKHYDYQFQWNMIDRDLFPNAESRNDKEIGKEIRKNRAWFSSIADFVKN